MIYLALIVTKGEAVSTMFPFFPNILTVILYSLPEVQGLYNADSMGFYQWTADGEQTGQLLSKEDALELYGFRIIEMNFSPPIENTFK